MRAVRAKAPPRFFCGQLLPRLGVAEHGASLRGTAVYTLGRPPMLRALIRGKI